MDAIITRKTFTKLKEITFAAISKIEHAFKSALKLKSSCVSDCTSFFYSYEKFTVQNSFFFPSPQKSLESPPTTITKLFRTGGRRPFCPVRFHHFLSVFFFDSFLTYSPLLSHSSLCFMTSLVFLTTASSGVP